MQVLIKKARAIIAAEIIIAMNMSFTDLALLLALITLKFDWAAVNVLIDSTNFTGYESSIILVFKLTVD